MPITPTLNGRLGLWRSPTTRNRATAFLAGPRSAAIARRELCRYYGLPLAGLDSHFYSADADECVRLFWKYGPVGLAL